MTMCDSGLLKAAALLFLAVSGTTAAAVDKCDTVRCAGPLSWYKSMGCRPVYKNPDDCCAASYDCSDVMQRNTSKCYVNGHEYAIGQTLRDEDANPCDIGCSCSEGYDGVASFTCAIVDCFSAPPQPGCYRKKAPSDCCPGENVCPEKPNDRATCVVDGKSYMDGESFIAPEDPELSCFCAPGYEGKNVEPFCLKPKRPYCDPNFKDAGSVHEHCAPVFYSSQSPQTSCSQSTRCQNKNDTVIHNHGELKNHHEDEENICIFGNLKMHLGDELNQATDYSSVCVKCVCEVPPIPTCQRLLDSECDVTKHPPFQN